MTVKDPTLLLSFLQHGKAQERIVKHYHYTDWPDHGVPSHTLPVLDYVQRSSEANPEDGGPIIVHCRFVIWSILGKHVCERCNAPPLPTIQLYQHNLAFRHNYRPKLQSKCATECNIWCFKLLFMLGKDHEMPVHWSWFSKPRAKTPPCRILDLSWMTSIFQVKELKFACCIWKECMIYMQLGSFRMHPKNRTNVPNITYWS